MNLKKCATLLAVSSFLLTGCGNGSSSKTVQEDGKYVLAALGDEKLFADDVFDDIIKTTTGKSAYFEAVLQKVMDEKCPVDDAMEIDADTIVEQIETTYKANYGENYEAQLEYVLSSSGYSNMSEYREYLVKSLQYSRFLENYIDDNYDEVFEDYYEYASPRKVSMVFVSMTDVENPTEDEASKLEEVKALVGTSKDFGEIAAEYSDDETSKTNNGNLGIVDTTSQISSTYGSDVETAVLALEEGSVSDAIKGTNGYYIFKCTSTQKDDIKDGINNLGIDSPLISYDNYLIYLVFNSYNVVYKEDDVKEIVTGVVNEALEAREKDRGGDE